MAWLRRKQTLVEAYLNDGTDERVFAITEWVNSHGGNATALLKNGTEYTKDFAAVRLNDSLLTNLAVLGFWVVDMGEGNFVAVPDSVMQLAYDVIEPPDTKGEVKN